ncbi:MAG: thiol:disulfide interchange protein [Gammaproteobacteria bacterium]|nr:MAG: thiol:disulfide interchange protein [Gammaproteobacteria bacterium]
MKKHYLFGMLFALIFVGLMGLFALGLKNDPNKLDLATKNSKIPAFSLPLLDSHKMISRSDLTTDKAYYLINFWGSWCPSCYAEHSYLLQLGQRETLYGVNWKDERSAGSRFIREGGNPFKAIIVDEHSVLAIGMGVYGAPETFVVKADGTILYRYAGPMSEAVWNKEFVPRIKTLEERQ